MSDGPLASGLGYYAAFEITGNLDQECLKKVLDDIRKILAGECKGQKVNGQIVKAARISAKTIDKKAKKKSPPSVNITIG